MYQYAAIPIYVLVLWPFGTRGGGGGWRFERWDAKGWERWGNRGATKWNVKKERCEEKEREEGDKGREERERERVIERGKEIEIDR